MADNSKKISPIPLCINWHEGMLLSQHHFQQNDLRNFRVLAEQISLLSSNHFGIRHLRTDTVSLTDGLYRVRELEAVFPDGLIFSFFPEKHAGLRPLEIDLAGCMQEDVNEATIYLAIAESSDDVSPILGHPHRFYSIDGGLVSDDNIKENEVRIPRLFPNGFLCTGDSVPEFCTGFPLCKIIRIDGVYHVKNWTPPCFFIERHFPLWKRCEKLAISIREKAVYLAEKLKNSSIGGTSYETGHILNQITTIMPGLEALVYSNDIRPYELYQKLSDVLGAVAVLIPTDMVPVMRPYDQQDIDACLYPVIDLIEHYISIIERGFSVIPFNRKERFFYVYMSQDNINSAAKFSKLYVGLKSQKTVDVSEVDLWMRDAVIVSDFAVDTVRTKRIKGADRTILKQEIVSRILPGIGVTLFEIDIDERFIRGEQNLHIFNPGNNAKIQPSEIILYLPRKEVTR
ncbi:MAG: type VI secretion system baseplate subunit TssK [Holosporales bacterium]|jgi:type VI secretion system protein ImpJ|nr:type VI secretion system baseplate subunit TssK [Holosporales bacterium]